ncbi:hypothetical protein KCU90_g1122, partial [Aureobasidium melanogenum]
MGADNQEQITSRSQAQPREAVVLRSNDYFSRRSAQHTRHGSLRQFRRIVLLAQMRGHQIAQARAVERGQDFSRRLIVQMPMIATNTRLQRLWIPAARQHPHIVIALEDQRVATAQHRADVRRGGADVGQHAKPARAIGEHVLQRLAGVVRNGIGENAEVADRHRFVAPQHLQIDIGFVGTHRAGGAPAHVQRDRPLARQRQRAANVVAMFMGNQNGVETLDARAEPRQPPLDFFG